MSVKDIMTRNVVTLRPSDYLSYAVKMFRENEFKSFPVVDKNYKVTGILSERDLLDITRHKTYLRADLLDILSYAPSILGVIADKLAFETDIREFEKQAKEITRGQVNKRMTKKPYTVRPEDSISKAISLMVDKRINHLPVVNEEEKLVGIIARADIIKAMSRVKNVAKTPVGKK